MKINVKTMTVIAMLAVLAFLAVLVCRIPLVLFLEYEPKNVILTIGGFIFGPVVSLLVTVVVALVELVTVSKDGGWGLLMNILASGSFAGIAALIYQKKRTLGGAAIGLISGIAASTALMIVWNYLITPLYMGLPRADVAKLLVPAFLPFNLIKGGLNAALVMLLYKPVVTALRRAKLIPKSESSAHGGARTYGVIAAIAAAVIAGCVLAVLAIQGVI